MSESFTTKSSQISTLILSNSAKIKVFAVNLADISIPSETELRHFLTADELLRGKLFGNKIESQKFFLRRIWLRQLLSNELKLSPTSIKIAYSKNHKPFLQHSHQTNFTDTNNSTKTDAKLDFNVASRDNFAVCAISYQGAVGIDIDYKELVICNAELPTHLLHPQEQNALLQLNPKERAILFARIWTAKEALFKRTGEGITEHMASANCLSAALHPTSQTSSYCYFEIASRFTVCVSKNSPELS